MKLEGMFEKLHLSQEPGINSNNTLVYNNYYHEHDMQNYWSQPVRYEKILVKVDND